MHLHQHGLWDMYFILSVIMQYYFFFFSQNILALVIGELFSWLLYPSDIVPSLRVWFPGCVFLLLFLSTFLLSGTARCARLILYISRPRPRGLEPAISPSSGSFYCIRILLGATCGCYNWGIITSKSSQLTEQGHVCIYTNT